MKETGQNGRVFRHFSDLFMHPLPCGITYGKTGFLRLFRVSDHKTVLNARDEPPSLIVTLHQYGTAPQFHQSKPRENGVTPRIA